MKAGDDEETSMKLVQTAEKCIYLYDFSHEYYANNNKKDTLTFCMNIMQIITRRTQHGGEFQSKWKL
jgi:hypothetical protein